MAARGLRGEAAIVGYAEWPAERRYDGPRQFTLEQWAELAADALADAGLSIADVDGLVCSDIREASMFVPATVVEYLGRPVNFAERIDLGGATAVGMVWRAAAAIELGICDVVVCALPSRPIPSNPARGAPDPRRWLGSSSGDWGSPQAEFEIPFGNIAQNAGYAMIARRYAETFGYDPRAMAKISVDQRTNACANPEAAFHGQPIDIDDVLASPMIADPLHRLEIVMPCAGGAAVVLASAEVAARCRHRPARVTGFGEHLTIKTPTYADDMTLTPVAAAARQAFAMAKLGPADMDAAQIYDCYTITVLLSLEDAGFCPKGTGAEFVRSRDLTYGGDFPLNTGGGQLGFGQAGLAGGMVQVVEAARQLMGRGEARQVADCDRVFVTGTGGVMSEQSALVLEGG
ncbi:MAG TPA: thiolase family protein [Pseudomonadales bacterium]|nr:thiolase family protein [Pseudomonadales bacterium]